MLVIVVAYPNIWRAFQIPETPRPTEPESLEVRAQEFTFLKIPRDDFHAQPGMKLIPKELDSWGLFFGRQCNQHNQHTDAKVRTCGF